ncbi:YebC/PmpR family DNA-binding transcriptional regulator [Alicyclobacillus sp. SO9]|uniref:YebC/PmpR family DNA-binding transcriptional regulator n=1 Tax=Alicyclobacillus sp. SO9 TaxID=2665646 RepID=UPI0018E7127A|nr:YebC/PmpR family DNA-binding transcriptional regulator [Alicyclobacillus sp. SO9]QQE77466.1 YebC/PmpR family DNA-binding transcriptional regulator [Alicyclobacillus sp. SO9]
MSGHSKWHNIQRRKGKQDAERGQLFTKLSRDIYLAAKEGGGNPDTNFRLKTAIEKAKQSNVPADNIARTIAKATGTLEGVTYEEVMYEGYGPNGVAVMMDIVTDNRNRSAADIRHIFSKRGGNLGESGCVAWMFDKIGMITLAKEDVALDTDDMMMQALEAGAADMRETDEEFILVTEPDEFAQVRDEIEQQGLRIQDSELTYEPKTTVALAADDADVVLDLIDALEEHDDVQNVYANLEVAES